MSVKRSPIKQNTAQHNLSSSSLDLSTGSSYVTHRTQKRNQGDDFESFMKKMETLFTSWTTKQDLKNETILESVNVIREQNIKITQSIEFVSAQYEEMRTKIEQLEKEKSADKVHIQNLEQKIEHLERNMNCTSLEIRNVPIKKGEKKDDLFSMVTNLCDSLNVPLDGFEIRNVYRGFSKSQNQKPIVVDFLSARIKENILVAVKQFTQQNGSKLSTSNLKLEGQLSTIYVSDYLTPKMKRLHFLVRDFSSTHCYKYCWATPGAIYLRKKEGDPAIRIKSEEDLKSFATGIL